MIMYLIEFKVWKDKMSKRYDPNRRYTNPYSIEEKRDLIFEYIEKEKAKLADRSLKTNEEDATVSTIIKVNNHYAHIKDKYTYKAPVIINKKSSVVTVLKENEDKIEIQFTENGIKFLLDTYNKYLLNVKEREGIETKFLQLLESGKDLDLDIEAIHAYNDKATQSNRLLYNEILDSVKAQDQEELKELRNNLDLCKKNYDLTRVEMEKELKALTDLKARIYERSAQMTQTGAFGPAELNPDPQGERTWWLESNLHSLGDKRRNEIAPLEKAFELRNRVTTFDTAKLQSEKAHSLCEKDPRYMPLKDTRDFFRYHENVNTYFSKCYSSSSKNGEKSPKLIIDQYSSIVNQYNKPTGYNGKTYYTLSDKQMADYSGYLISSTASIKQLLLDHKIHITNLQEGQLTIKTSSFDYIGYPAYLSPIFLSNWTAELDTEKRLYAQQDVAKQSSLVDSLKEELAIQRFMLDYLMSRLEIDESAQKEIPSEEVVNISASHMQMPSNTTTTTIATAMPDNFMISQLPVELAAHVSISGESIEISHTEG